MSFVLSFVVMLSSWIIAGDQSPDSSSSWSSDVSFETLPSIKFRWRTVSAVQSDQRNLIQFDFMNSSETSISFDYVIITDSSEVKVGAIRLKGQRHRLSGWYFAGRRIVQVDAMDPVLFKKTYREFLPYDN